MGDDGGRLPGGRPLSRAEIDVLVRESLRLEKDLDRLDRERLEDILETTPYRVATLPRERRRFGSAGWAVLAVVAVVVLCLVVVRPFLSSGLVTTAATEPHRYADGHYAFMRMQPDGRDLPVGFNPCLRLPISINYAGAPGDVRERVEEAITEINAASGMKLDYGGATQLRSHDAGQTGGVVISFADETTERGLSGNVVGRGGSSSYLDPTPGSTTYYLGGGVVLDTDSFNPASASVKRAILLHEIGHTLGLDHATGSTEIMNPSVNAASHYQHGDLTGLAILGDLPCR